MLRSRDWKLRNIGPLSAHFGLQLGNPRPLWHAQVGLRFRQYQLLLAEQVLSQYIRGNRTMLTCTRRCDSEPPKKCNRISLMGCTGGKQAYCHRGLRQMIGSEVRLDCSVGVIHIERGSPHFHGKPIYMLLTLLLSLNNPLPIS